MTPAGPEDPLPPAAARGQAAVQAPPPLSSLSLPLTVPLDGLRQAVNAHLPQQLARIDHLQRVLGGAGVQVLGTVTRTGAVRILPSQDGEALEVAVPLRASLQIQPEISSASKGRWLGRLEDSLRRDVGGAAEVRLRLRPTLRPDWTLGADIRSELDWIDPLSLEVLPGTRLSLGTLADSAVRGQLQNVTAEVARAVSESAALRRQAEQLWQTLQRPWPLPLPDEVSAAYGQVMPTSLGLGGLRLEDDALRVTLQAEGYLQAALGEPPAALPPAGPLPALEVSGPAAPSALHLRVPLRLPSGELSGLLARAARQGLAAHPLPGGRLAPQLSLLGLKVGSEPDTQRLNLTARLEVQVLGRREAVEAHISGRPWLRPGGREISLENPEVTLSAPGSLLRRAAAAQAQRWLAQHARLPLGPYLDQLEAEVRGRLPSSPVPGVTLRGDLGGLGLDDLRVTRQGLEVTAAADGALDLHVNAAAWSGPPLATLQR